MFSRLTFSFKLLLCDLIQVSGAKYDFALAFWLAESRREKSFSIKFSISSPLMSTFVTLLNVLFGTWDLSIATFFSWTNQNLLFNFSIMPVTKKLPRANFYFFFLALPLFSAFKRDTTNKQIFHAPFTSRMKEHYYVNNF